MTNHADLIARLEALEGPDREVANEVLRACGWKQETHYDRVIGPEPVWLGPAGQVFAEGNQPNPLTCLDAAKTLIPEGWVYTIEADACWLRTDERKVSSFLERRDDTCTAIAISAAALKARSTP